MLASWYNNNAMAGGFMTTPTADVEWVTEPRVGRIKSRSAMPRMNQTQGYANRGGKKDKGSG